MIDGLVDTTWFAPPVDSSLFPTALVVVGNIPSSYFDSPVYPAIPMYLPIPVVVGVLASFFPTVVLISSVLFPASLVASMLLLLVVDPTSSIDSVVGSILPFPPTVP